MLKTCECGIDLAVGAGVAALQGDRFVRVPVLPGARGHLGIRAERFALDRLAQQFGDVVNRAGYVSPVRTPRGRDILAACGQLRSESVNLKASERARAGA